MIKTDCLILERGDLIGSKKNIDIKEIEYTDFNFREPFIKSSMVIFVDNDPSGKTKILKNRYGNQGNKFDIDDLHKDYYAGTNSITPNFNDYYIENYKK